MKLSPKQLLPAAYMPAAQAAVLAAQVLHCRRAPWWPRSRYCTWLQNFSAAL